jgi:hypothetical protein
MDCSCCPAPTAHARLQLHPAALQYTLPCAAGHSHTSVCRPCCVGLDPCCESLNGYHQPPPPTQITSARSQPVAARGTRGQAPGSSQCMLLLCSRECASRYVQPTCPCHRAWLNTCVPHPQLKVMHADALHGRPRLTHATPPPLLPCDASAALRQRFMHSPVHPAAVPLMPPWSRPASHTTSHRHSRPCPVSCAAASCCIAQPSCIAQRSFTYACGHACACPAARLHFPRGCVPHKPAHQLSKLAPCLVLLLQLVACPSAAAACCHPTSCTSCCAHWVPQAPPCQSFSAAAS